MEPEASISTVAVDRLGYELQRKALNFLVHVREELHTTQVVIDEIVRGVDELLGLHRRIIEEYILQHMDNGFVSEDSVRKSFQNFTGVSLFTGGDTKYLLDGYLAKHGFNVKPEIIVKSYKPKVLNSGMIKEVPNEFGYIVRFLPQLGALLKNRQVLCCVETPRECEINSFKSVLDGYYYQTHPVFIKDKKALGFIIFCDDVEVTDPLSGDTVQIRVYYWQLGNIYPELRSSLKAINVIALVPTPVAKKYGNGAFLEDFIQAMNKLGDTGVTFTINGTSRLFHGFLIFVCGDTPALANLGGFKESVSANKPCRQCMASLSDLYTSGFRQKNFSLRTMESHEQHLRAIEGTEMPIEGGQGEEEEKADTDNPSVRYGVNSRSPLLDICHFDITKCLPQDVMHVLLEGVVDKACRLLLYHAVIERGLNLRLFNNVIQRQNYGPFQNDKPSVIERHHLSKGLKHNASQTYLLANMIPFLAKTRCLPRKLSNFIRLLMILNLCMSYQLKKEDVELLENMISEYLEEFQVLYPGEMTPKFHFLVHLPMQILLFGVLRQQWAMRFEAFNAYLKRLSEIIHNKKNICFSLLSRFLVKRGFQLINKPDSFLYSSHLASVDKSGKEVSEDILRALQDVEAANEIVILKSVQVFGATFTRGSNILVCDKDGDFPEFAVVSYVLLFNNEYYLIYQSLTTVGFSWHFNAYAVKPKLPVVFRSIRITELTHQHTLLKLRVHGICYVLLGSHRKVAFSELKSQLNPSV